MGEALKPTVLEAAPRAGGKAAVFLDRDGTIIEEVGYVNHLSRVKLYPGAAEAIRRLNEAGVPAIVVTNQSGVAWGYFAEELVRKVHERIAQELAAHSARLDAFYYCPHHPYAQVEAYRVVCRCRKPSTGMLDGAAQRFRIDFASSYVVGDSYRDMQLGFNAGARTNLVLTGYGRGEFEHRSASWPRRPDRVSENILEAVEFILKDLSELGRRQAEKRE